MSEEIAERDLGLVVPGPGDQVRILQDGKSRRARADQLPASAAVLTRLSTLEVSQNAGLIGYATKALMDADLAHGAGTVALVTNDPTPANNVTFRKTGASGAGAWVVSVDRITVLDGRVASVEVSGAATAAKLAPIAAQVDPALIPGKAWAVADANGNIAIQVDDAGLTSAADFRADAINGIAGTVIENASPLLQSVRTETQPGVAVAFADELGRVALSIAADGGVAVAALEVGTINGLTVGQIAGGVTVPEGAFTAELNFILNAGQSLAQLSSPPDALTTVQEYDNVGFPAAAIAPAAYLPLTVSNTQALDGLGAGRGESPQYGALGHIKALIQSENNLAYTQHKYQLLTCNNAHGGTPISEHVKGTSYYTAAISQVTAGYTIAQAGGRSYKFQAFTWTQGEADHLVTSRAIYKAALKQMVADLNTDGKAITGQAEDVICICYQTAGSDIAVAQLEASEEDPARIFIATPTYFMPRGDGIHLTPIGSKWLGGYYGLVYKRVKVDGIAWKPLSPKTIYRQGRVINVRFNVPKPPIVFDTTLMAAQASMGFSVVNSAGTVIAIAGVEIIGRDTVKITTSADIPAGSKLRYALSATSGNGNLRDSETLVYAAISKPMHNWCIAFEKSI